MHREEVTPAQYDWLLATQYNKDREQLESDLEHELPYVLELLRFCPVALLTVDPFLPPYRPRGFVESPMSSFPDEDLRTLERRQVPIDKIVCTQWRIYSDAVNYYQKAFTNNLVVPPVLVHFDPHSGLYYVKDGHHRLYAHWQLRRGRADVALSKTGMPQARELHVVSELKLTER